MTDDGKDGNEVDEKQNQIYTSSLIVFLSMLLMR